MANQDPKDFKGKDVATEIALGSLVAGHQNTRDQLAILRQTRGQRQVGELKIPAHLKTPISLDVDLAKPKAGRAGGGE